MRNYEGQQSQDNWDTLGQPSGKYDYLVRYKGPENWQSFAEERSQIEATGWDDSDDVPLGYNSDYEPQITDETDYPILDNTIGQQETLLTMNLTGKDYLDLEI